MAMSLDMYATPLAKRDPLSFSRDLWWETAARIKSCLTHDDEGGPCAIVKGGGLHRIIKRMWRLGWRPHTKSDTARISL